MDAMDVQYSRQYVQVTADMGNWAQIEPLFDELDRRPLETAEQFQKWLLDQSDLEACIQEEGTKRRVAMTCETDNPEKEKANLHFLEQIDPKCKPRWQKLQERYVASPLRATLPMPRFFVYDRSVSAAVKLFREKNVALQTEDDKLDNQYKKLCAAMTVQYDGKEQTLQQMGKYQRDPDRAVREKTWVLVAERRLQDRDKLDDIFDQLVRIRQQIAKNADYENFRDYQFQAYQRFDYGPKDCMAFHDAIEKVVVPARRALQEQRRKSLGVDRLRPWDVLVDPKNRPALKPFQSIPEFCEKTSKVFHRLDPELGGQFDAMIKAKWLDLDSRKGKAPGGYQSTFDEHRHPFIFMNAVGLHNDVMTLLHEGGHAFHAIACRSEPLLAYRHYGMEMAEVSSMGMEMLAMDYLDEFYKGNDLIRAKREHLEDLLMLFPWIATIDAFQHWIYLHPNHTRDERTKAWLDLQNRFGGIEDWSGYEAAKGAMWHRQLHLFSVPFYYIEYGIAQVGALQLWQNAKKDPKKALAQYKAAQALGGSRPLPELWQAAGLKFDFSEATLRPLIEAVQAELVRLPE